MKLFAKKISQAILRYLAMRRMRNTFRHAAGTYEDAKIVCDRKGHWMVVYLRARRARNVLGLQYRRDAALQEKKWARSHFLHGWELRRNPQMVAEELRLILEAKANIRAEHARGEITKEQFQKEMAIMSRSQSNIEHEVRR